MKFRHQELSLNHYIAQAGICSRRKAVSLIVQGKVTVNNRIETQPGYRVQPEDRIHVEGAYITLAQYVYVLLNKPKGFITTSSDERNRKTVMDLIAPATSQKLHAVGRLDRDSTGLLLLTNDGSLTQRLTHPKYGIAKTYRVRLDKVLRTPDMQRMKEGIILEDGRVEFDECWIDLQNKKIITVVLHSGKYRVIRRAFQELGYAVLALDRTEYAGLSKKGLRVGQWRFLTPAEVAFLKKQSTEKRS